MIRQPRKFDKIYLLFENNKKLINKFVSDKSNCCLFAKTKIIEDLKLSGDNIISLESIFDGAFFEFKYQGVASKFFERVCVDFQTGGESPLKINGVSILDANSGNIMLYYLQKACKYADMAAFLFDRFSADRVIISSLKEQVAVAIYYESRKRKIDTAIMSVREAWIARCKERMMSSMWFFNEILRSILNVAKEEIKNDFKIAFFCKGLKYHEAIVPIANTILVREAGNILIIAKGDIPVEKQIRNERIQYINFHAFRDYRYGLRLLYQSIVTSRYWANKFEQQSHKCEDRDIHNSQYLLHILNKWFKNNISRAMRAALLSDAIFEKLRPQIIVVMDYADFEAKTLTLIGKRRGITSFCIQYGMASKYSNELRYFKQDYLGVMGSKVLSLMKELGMPQEQIFITGSPRFDSYMLDNKLAEDVRQDLNISKMAKVVAFMSIPPAVDGVGQREAGLSLEEYKCLLSMIYSIPSLSTDFILIVKPHPEEVEHIYLHKQYAIADSFLADRILLVQHKSAYGIINSSDLVITMQSTTGLEAILMNKPLIMVNITGREDMVDYATSGAAYPVRKKDDLPVAINGLLYNKEVSDHYEKMRSQYLKQNLSYIHKSAIRTADVIMQLSNQGRNKQENHANTKQFLQVP